jgi:heme exporter protein A
MTLLAARGLAAQRGYRVLFAGLDFALGAGGALALAGPNGSGKTTLLRLLAGLARPLAGQILWQGQPVDADLEAQRRRVAYVGHLAGIKPSLTPREQLAFEARLGRPRLAEAIERLRLGGFADLPIALLSAGQRRRTALARLLLSPAPLWLLDEPATSLDTEGEASLWALAEEHRAAGGLLVLATHAPVPLAGLERLEVAGLAPDDARLAEVLA